MIEPVELKIIDQAIDGLWPTIVQIMENGKDQKGLYEQINDLNTKINSGLQIPGLTLSIIQYFKEKNEKPQKGESEFSYTGWRLSQIYRPNEKDMWSRERSFGVEKEPPDEKSWFYEYMGKDEKSGK